MTDHLLFELSPSADHRTESLTSSAVGSPRSVLFNPPDVVEMAYVRTTPNLAGSTEVRKTTPKMAMNCRVLQLPLLGFEGA